MVYMFLANGFEEIEALCPLDLLRRAGVDVKTVAVGAESLTVTGSHGITVLADMDEKDFSDGAPEMVILPGGMPGATNLDNSKVVDGAIRAALACDAYLAAICAAPMILTAAGMGVALDFGLALVAALRGKEAAIALRRTVLAD